MATGLIGASRSDAVSALSLNRPGRAAPHRRPQAPKIIKFESGVFCFFPFGISRLASRRNPPILLTKTFSRKTMAQMERGAAGLPQRPLQHGSAAGISARETPAFLT